MTIGCLGCIDAGDGALGRRDLLVRRAVCVAVQVRWHEYIARGVVDNGHMHFDAASGTICSLVKHALLGKTFFFVPMIR